MVVVLVAPEEAWGFWGFWGGSTSMEVEEGWDCLGGNVMAFRRNRDAISSLKRTISFTGPKRLIRAGLVVQIASPPPPENTLLTLPVKISGTPSLGTVVDAPPADAEAHGSLSPGTKMKLELPRRVGKSDNVLARWSKDSL
jgi:hypothetical protein